MSEKRPFLRSLIARWLTPEIKWELDAPMRASVDRLVEEGLIKDHEREFAEFLARQGGMT